LALCPLPNSSNAARKVVKEPSTRHSGKGRVPPKIFFSGNALPYHAKAIPAA